MHQRQDSSLAAAIAAQAALLFACAALLAMILMELRQHGRPEPPRRFEFGIATVEDGTIEDELARYGGAGWTIVNARRVTRGELEPPAYEFILQRESVLP